MKKFLKKLASILVALSIVCTYLFLDNTHILINTALAAKKTEYSVSDEFTSNHTYEFVETVDPTCVREGYDLYRCSGCNEERRSNLVDSTGHNNVEKIVEATCVDRGYTLYQCSICGLQNKGNFVEANGHNFVDGTCSACAILEEDAIESDYPINGTKTYTIHKPGAKRIAITFSKDTALYLSTGEFSGWMELLDSDRQTWYYFSNDGEKISNKTYWIGGDTITIIASGVYFALTEVEAYYTTCNEHLNTEIRNQVTPTCYNSGYTGDEYCVDCGVLVDGGDYLNAHSLTSEAIEIISPTCTQEGYTFYECTLCGHTYFADWNWDYHPNRTVVEVVEPVCGESEGYTVYSCFDCGEEFNSDWIWIAHNKGEIVETVDPVCGESYGYTVYNCSNCGEEYEDDDWIWLDHTKGELIKIVDPVCGVSDGYTVYSCSNCGEEYKTDWTWKDHNGELIESTTATCTEPSYNICKCTDCGAEYEEWVSGSLGHSMKDGQCIRCDAVASEIQLNVLTDVNITIKGDMVYFMFKPEISHMYYFYSDSQYETYGCLYDSEMNILSSFTDYGDYDRNYTIKYFLKAGETYYIASGFYSDNSKGSFKIKVTDEFVSNHSYELVETVLPSCGRRGYERYVCSVCGGQIENYYTDAIDHNYEDGICSNCGCHENNHMLDVKPKEGSSTIVDSENFLIYGLSTGLDYNEFKRSCLTFCNDINIYRSSFNFGTGIELLFESNGETLAEYTIVIFGDVNGDGWYDGTDSIIVSCLANGLLTKDNVSEAVYMAADCNHDGAIDALDVALLEQAGVLLASVDQTMSAEELITNSAYIEYLNLIDQTADIEIDVEDKNEDDSDTEIEDDVADDNVSDNDQDSSMMSLIDLIIAMIKSFFEMLFASFV